ncbi:MAG: aromatic ring-hydroxylating dioxygenase subunit alpha [Acidobacteriota bacterium]
MQPVSMQPMTLPARFYTDPDVFRAEMDRFYFNQWVCVGREQQLSKPGDYFLAEIGGESAIVTRDASGQIRAFYNVCRHRGTRMCTEHAGAFPNGRIRCPYHAWTYSTDGSLVGAPHMDSSEFRREEYPLHGIAVAVWEGHVFLHFGNPTSLATQLNELTTRFAAWRMSELRLHRRITYDVAANWKLIVLNYNECLHCPSVHPALHKLTDYLGADNVPPSPAYIGGSMGFKPGIETMTLDGVRRRDYLPGLNEAQRQQVAYYALLPNLMLALHPDYMLTHTLWPRALNRTEIVCEFHFHPAEIAKPGFVADDAIEFWDQVNREDWHVSELSQLGISSRAYTPGPYSRREELLHAFDQLVSGPAQSPLQSR